MSDIIDGNSQAPLPESTIPAAGIMTPIAGGFGPMITTTDVIGGMGGVQPVTLQANDSSVFCEHHLIGTIPIAVPAQDVLPGESKAGA